MNVVNMMPANEHVTERISRKSFELKLMPILLFFCYVGLVPIADSIYGCNTTFYKKSYF